MSDDRETDAKTWKLLEKAVLAGVQEQRRSRRWGIVFKSLTFLYLLLFLLLLIPLDSLQKTGSRSSGHTAVIDVKGVIAKDSEASADNLIKALRAAFEDKGTKGVVLQINSPGGSPVQSGYVYDEIGRLRALNPSIQVYAVIEDLGASGAYYIASAADQIYADKASLVGSIGVTAAGFGYVGAMEKLGVERRVYVSGEHKGFLDPFRPQDPQETTFWQSVLDTTHRQFIDSVKKGRGERLKADEHPELFSGLIWSGEQGLALGLIDGLGNTDYVAREVIKVDQIEDFTIEESPLDRFTKRLGASMADQFALWMGLQLPVLH